MRVLLFARTRTRCTQPHLDHVCVQFGGSFQTGSIRAWCRVGQDVRNAALPLVWRHEWFIVEKPLVGDPVRIWIASSQIAAGLLEFSNGDVKVERRSDALKQRPPGKRTGCRPGRTRMHPVHWQASRQPSSVAGSEHKFRPGQR